VKGTRDKITEHLAVLGESAGRASDLALILDGKTLKYALSCEVRADLLTLCTSCRVVICCRVSPIQKAEVSLFIV